EGLGRNEARHVMSVAADVTEDQRWPDLSRNEMPIGRRVGLLSARQRGVVALHIFDVDHPDIAEVTVADHGARLTDEWKTSVVEGLAEDSPGSLYARDKIERVGEPGTERLVGNDVEAGVERRDCQRVVAIVRRHDRHDLHAVG